MCRASGQDSMRDLLPVFSDNESSAGDRGNGLLEPDACGIVSDGCSSEPVSVDSLYGQLVLRGVLRNIRKVPGWYMTITWIWAAAICASTLFTKQHGILDVAAGIALAELSYICVIRWKKTERFRLWMEKKRI